MRIKVKKPVYQALIAFLGILSVASAFAGTSMLFVHSDHLGTPQVMTDANQIVVWRANYTPFGEAEVDEDPDGDGVAVEMPLRFPGQYFDKETGLHYNYYRDYDPSLGRYIQSDPIGLRGGLNTYSYVLNNPLIYTDPKGLAVQACLFPPVGAVCVTAAQAVLDAALLGLGAAYATSGSTTDTGLPDEAANDDIYDQCPPDDGCEKAKKSLIAYLGTIRSLYLESSTEKDVIAAQKAIQRANKKVSAHNKRCPNHKVQPLPPILF